MLLLDAMPLFGPWRIRRDEEKFHRWQAFLQTQTHGARIFQIVGIRQQARTGLKAYGRCINNEETSALWIEGAWPTVGMFMSAPGDFGGGPHHGEWVFYAKAPYYFFSQSHYAGVRRHMQRAAKAIKVGTA